MRQGLSCASGIEVNICLVLLHAELIIFLHILAIYGCIVFKILAIGSAKLLQVLLYLRLKLLVVLILLESLGSGALGILTIVDAKKSKDITMGSKKQFRGGGVLYKCLTTFGSTTHEHPHIAERLVLITKTIGIFQHWEELALGLKHIGGHATIILASHIIEELIETVGANLSKF